MFSKIVAVSATAKQNLATVCKVPVVRQGVEVMRELVNRIIIKRNMLRFRIQNSMVYRDFVVS
jgi:hypothetical protein